MLSSAKLDPHQIAVCQRKGSRADYDNRQGGSLRDDKHCWI